MTSPEIIQAETKVGTERVVDWIDQQAADGSALITVEGLCGAGKSQLLLASNLRGLTALDLDDLLPSDVPSTTPWLEAVLPAAKQRLEHLLADRSVKVIGGVQALDVLRACGFNDAHAFVSIYIKKMSLIGDRVEWFEGELEMQEPAEPNTYFGSIRNYHRFARPWESADLVYERIPDESSGGL